MKATIELTDEMFIRAKEQASREGVDVSEFLSAVVAKQLNAGSGELSGLPTAGPRSQLPTIKGRGSKTITNVTPELQAQIQEEDDLASHRRSFGR